MPEMDVDDSRAFAELLRRFRRGRHLTQEELAERAGISPGAVSLLERGLTQAPQKATVQLLGAALQLAPAETVAFAAAARRSGRPNQEPRSDATQAAPVSVPNGLDEGLVVPLTPLIGRERDEAGLLELIARPTTRLLTLSGPAGVGKTRLALELATRLRGERAQGVVFVGLIPVQEPDRVLPAIAQALGVRDSGHLPLRDALVLALRDQRLMLVLDNFEQVLPAARSVLELLVACPQVKALVTSRSPLNVRGERCYPVAPLALPDPTQMDSLDALQRVPTVELFLERATAAQSDFSIATLQEGRLVANICARLDGLPLAIELAAARVRHFGLWHLHDRLTQPEFLGVLSSGPQDLADHQRTMRSTIAWSYQLLGEEERQLFRWLGVFVGGASPDAAAAVGGLADEALIDGLAALVDANLLQCADVGGACRYTQLVNLRAYAQEQLRAAGEWETVRQSHANYFLGLAELIIPEAIIQRASVVARIETEYENVRAALVWAWETDATTHGLRMAGALWRFWFTHSPYPAEGLDWLERFIARAAPISSSPHSTSAEEQSALAQALMGVVAISHRLGRFEHAREAAERLLALRRQMGDTVQIAHALDALANPLGKLGLHQLAFALYKEAIALHRESDNRSGMIVPLQNLGGLYYELGQPREALAYFEQSLALSCEFGESDLARAATWIDVADISLVLDEPQRAREIAQPSHQLLACHHDTFGTAAAAFTVGRAAWRLGDVLMASASLDEAERLYRSLGNPATAACVLYFRASLALDQGDFARALRDLSQALDDLAGYARASEYQWWLIERVGSLARHRGEPELAARLYGAAIANRDASRRPIEPAEREARVRDRDALHASLGDSALQSCLAEGQALSLEQAVAAARRELERPFQ